MLIFSMLVASGAALAFGALPAWQIARSVPDRGLLASRGVPPRIGAIRRVLIGVEVAVATVLVILMGLLVRSFAHLQSVDPGFRADGALTLRLSLPRIHYANRADLVLLYDRLHPRLAALPGVEHVAAANVVPLNNYRATANFWFDGRPKPAPDQMPEAHYRTITPGYFAALGLPLVAGRAFTERDRADSEPVAIVSTPLVRRFWGEGFPLGEYLQIEDSPGSSRRVRIVGVAGAVKHLGLEVEPTPDVLVPLTQMPEAVVQWVTNNMYWIVRTRTDPAAMRPAVARALQAIDPDVPASNVRTLEETIDGVLAPRRFNLRLVSLFGLAALLLASGGVFVVTAQTVGERTKEIGIRAALGATSARVAWTIASSTAPAIAIGLIAGAAAARIGARAMGRLLFGVSPTDATTFAAAIAVLAAAGTLAAYLPARRARRIDPVVALRAD